jgi:cytochrome P450
MPAESCPIQQLAAQFHHQDPAILADPWPLFERLRTECPVAHSEKFGGFWILSRYDDILAAARDTETFSSAQGVTVPPMGFGLPLLPFEIDPPRHTAYRRLLMKRFAAPAVAALEPFASAEADRLLDRLSPTEQVDLVNDYALPLTSAVFGQLLTLPVEDRTTLAHWTNRIMERVSNPEAAMEAMASLRGYLEALIRSRREQPGDDILGILLTTELLEGRKLTDDEVLSLCFTFVLAGLETTIIAMGAAMLYLARHPDLKARFAGDERLLELAVEEFLRIEPPAHAHARTVTADIELHGQTLKAGDRVVFLWGAANHDPAQFAEPERFIPDRHPNRHFTFGAGPHRCIGADLARMEIQVALRHLLRRYPDYVVAEGVEIPSFKPARAPRVLPVVLSPISR